jgi:ribokinase
MNAGNRMNRVLVVGSINMDLVVEAERMPVLGETLSGRCFSTRPGGKGANQAVAASRLGASVSIIGCVGQDDHGRQLVDGLQQENIDTRHVRVTEHCATGVALITLSQGDNAIIVVPGANHALMPEDVLAAETAFVDADVVLCQLEIPLPTVCMAAQLAARYGKPFLLNPAPASPLPDELLCNTTLLTPNEHELASLFSSDPAQWQATLCMHPQVMMTRGGDGVWFSDESQALHHQPSFSVPVIDTTGAGDTFNGALAAFWGLGRAQMAELACAAGALSVTRPGAQGGMPTWEALRAFVLDRERAG